MTKRRKDFKSSCSFSKVSNVGLSNLGGILVPSVDLTQKICSWAIRSTSMDRFSSERAPIEWLSDPVFSLYTKIATILLIT